jgi:CheY-like chemotaxis protein
MLHKEFLVIITQHELTRLHYVLACVFNVIVESTTMQTGAIWIIDQDEDDLQMIKDVWKELEIQNELVWFSNADQVLEKFEKIKEAPFLILCDVNLPKIDGFKLREMILSHPGRVYHSVPFIFWSTVASEEQIRKAYNLGAHGFFIKDSSYTRLKQSFQEVLTYWQNSKVPKKKI